MEKKVFWWIEEHVRKWHCKECSLECELTIMVFYVYVMWKNDL